MRRDVNILSLQVEKSSLQMLNLMIKSLCEVFVMRNFNGKSYKRFCVVFAFLFYFVVFKSRSVRFL